jgi:uncharacterized protein
MAERMALGSSSLYLVVLRIAAIVSRREMEPAVVELRDDAARQRLEMVEQGQIVFANYRRDGQRMFIDHVEAPIALRGTGAAGRFMEGLADLARRDGLTLIPICSYAATWLARHPDQSAGLMDRA